MVGVVSGRVSQRISEGHWTVHGKHGWLRFGAYRVKMFSDIKDFKNSPRHSMILNDSQ